MNPLPPTVQQGLERFCEQLRQDLGAQLVAVILYGGLAKGEYVPDRSDVNVMVVLQTVDTAALDRAAPAIQKGERDFRLAVLLLGEDDLRRSTGVFPIKFLDIQRHHRLLWGQDVLADLTINREHLRLRCEQEIKNLLLRLRRFYLQRVQRPELIESTLTRALSSFLINVSVLVELKTGQEAVGKPAAVEAAQRIGLDGKILGDLLALKRGELEPNLQQLKQLFDAFMHTVKQAAEMVDKV